MVSLRKVIAFVTVLLIVYNALFAYVIINSTSGNTRTVFLGLLGLDFLVIFYFIQHIASEMTFEKPGERKAKRNR